MSLEPDLDAPASAPATRHTVVRVRDHGVVSADDDVAVEEPLEIRLGGLSLAITMRTPGHDEELVAGLLHSERVITSADDLDVVARYRVADGDPQALLRRLKQEDGPNLVTQSSTELVHALLATGLVDAMSIFTVPVVLGKGKKLFADGSALHSFKRTRSRVLQMA